MHMSKILGTLLCLLIGLQSIQAQDKLIKIGEVTNEIRMGKFAGNTNLAYGVQNILEEILMDMDYYLDDYASETITLRLVFFDVKNIGKNIGIYHKDVTLTQIIAVGELLIDGKVVKSTVQRGQSKTISTSTLVIADDGTFNQQTASIALKKVCVAVLNKLL
jgi:hypothetical protein